MKNIHLIPTEKPSRLVYFEASKELKLHDNHLTFKTFERSTHHIYITSDEEISRDTKPCWCLDDKDNSVNYYQGALPLHNYIGYKKIILTTDPYLISEGVQEINDEFLEWFVKNPTCESVEVKKGFEDGTAWGYNFLDYKIIIPQEEPKQETFIKADNVDGQWLSPVPTERAWQEEQLVNIFGHYPNASPKWQYMNGLIQNSLQGERMYSEEDLEVAFFEGRENNLPFIKWFEQFKKK